MTDHLIIFAKNPELGKTKTRLGNKLGDDVALAVYYNLIHRTQEVTADVNVTKIVYYSSFVDREDSWDNITYKKKRQKGENLGVRMAQAMKDSFEEGATKVVLVGTDIYDLTSNIIQTAFNELDDHDVVIGPAKDGGYYLVGLSKPVYSIFDLDSWSHSEVYNETMALINQANLSSSVLVELNDIDEPEDLKGTDLEKFLFDIGK
ncbi:TIGR04282 family arsenosugar biosynthesis glycosyltransferase [Fulvivirga lutea]|uniref:TIGR04282 family arsenosugar biosynthesis glycosyltransferase n=1 Tax=Fulvivirga lutea TaxID=2810512 RepID=A0A974WFD9_9BACT|nr:TIGR04282 family arsenosugar biosynthesis glycosyltransferase [Fulvivirga lutea]QSE97469.1 TIGR04282 family arsenosugar biosynthesis glycosyltransferase [Fulvivirga lutea]